MKDYADQTMAAQNPLSFVPSIELDGVSGTGFTQGLYYVQLNTSF